jgi:hypothetical protein
MTDLIKRNKQKQINKNKQFSSEIFKNQITSFKIEYKYLVELCVIKIAFYLFVK